MARSKKAQAAIDGALSIPMPEDRVGLGVDLVDISKMRAILERTPSFSEKMFGSTERDYCNSAADSAAHFAARFAAKEAVVKALGCGFTRGIHPRHIEVIQGKGGRPEVVLYGPAREVADEMGVYDIPVSLSHTHDDAIACAIALTRGARVSKVERIDPAEELTRQFRDARKMLEEL